MTINELILLVESSGFYDITDMRSKETIGCLEYFAAKVAAQEREKIAQFIQDFNEFEDDPAVSGTAIIARAIREGGKQ